MSLHAVLSRKGHLTFVAFVMFQFQVNGIDVFFHLVLVLEPPNTKFALEWFHASVDFLNN